LDAERLTTNLFQIKIYLADLQWNGPPDQMSEKESLTENYVRDFDPWAYLEAYRKDVNEDKEYRFMQDSLHEVFSEGTFFGKRLLDLGSGPSIHSVISASRHYDDIYLSDYAPQNLSVLADWWTGKISHMDHVIKHCLHLEHNSQTVTERNNEMRQKTRGILRVDVRKTNPFSPNYVAPFDTIISGYCLDSATSCLEDYEKTVANISPMLNRNGTLVFIGATDQSFYSFGDCEFKHAAYSREELYPIYEKNGLKIEYFKEFGNKQANLYDGSIFMAVARKSMND
ncbi:hypothetical protein ScPMuIL_016927, partial [Solemya velum]